MKRIVLCSTALASGCLVAVAAQAADPIQLTLGGYMEYWMAGASQSSSFGNRVNNFDIQGDSQIYFTGKTTLDNGVEVGARVQISSGSDYNDPYVQRSYMWMSGDYGKAIAGKYRDVVWLTHNYAPEASHLDSGLGGSDFYQILPVSSGKGVRALDPNQKPTNYANKILYLTPRAYGFQFGTSFTPSNNTSGDNASETSETIIQDAEFDQAWAWALSYSGNLAGVGLNAAVGYDFINGRQDNTIKKGGDVHNFQTSILLSYQGFSLGGSFNRMAAPTDSFYYDKNGRAWEIGVGYAEGPYAVSLAYVNSSTRGVDMSNTTLPNLTGTHDMADFYRMGARYTLGPGVDLWGALAYLDAQSHTGNKADGNEGAIGGAIGLRLDF
ncbi:MAG: porin [Rhodospirillaceae bacterium]|nr:porin [Rhodospirillaceae bacterium]